MSSSRQCLDKPCSYVWMASSHSAMGGDGPQNIGTRGIRCVMQWADQQATKKVRPVNFLHVGSIEKHVPYDLDLGVIELFQHREGTLQTRNDPEPRMTITSHVPNEWQQLFMAHILQSWNFKLLHFAATRDKLSASKQQLNTIGSIVSSAPMSSRPGTSCFMMWTLRTDPDMDTTFEKDTRSSRRRRLLQCGPFAFHLESKSIIYSDETKNTSTRHGMEGNHNLAPPWPYDQILIAFN
ncbi:uncharacterized protein LAESUDRAFT_716029 [Laetiporus sulphureus 93-53]|uniref:Uncharacterized protein n=1 Tax=Laetiporus sulphureus 93-53 TaxID=1314785 RepID=A0A165CX69_9APHY|nr:uncharacterized protein LAESUDRAFT_716029 [Laetiporus sulphureus 93-53]KZT03639.1 hypothetical protein LAESUDRAFT_716029 [Laetiporus sulphureus 93-53]